MYIIAVNHKNNYEPDMGFTPFDKPSECLQDINQMRVAGLFSEGMVLATNGIDYNFVVYLINLDEKNKNKTNRGDVLEIAENECYKQIGILAYTNPEEEIKTVPVINIMDK